jgi:hypothetical protein
VLPTSGFDAANPYLDPKLNHGPVMAFDRDTFVEGNPASRVLYFANFYRVGDLVKVTSNASSVWQQPVAMTSYKPTAVSCGAACGTANVCDYTPGSNHKCNTQAMCSSGTICVQTGQGMSMNGQCTCPAGTTCVSGGTCSCTAFPGQACTAGACGCPGSGQTCNVNHICTCTSTAQCPAGQTCDTVNGVCGTRVTAMAAAQLWVPNPTGGPPATVKMGFLFIAHGSVVSIMNLDALPNPTQEDVDLAQVYAPEANTTPPESTVQSILGIAIHPDYGDIYVEAKGTNGYSYLLNLLHPNHKVVHAFQKQQQLKHAQSCGLTGDPACPSGVCDSATQRCSPPGAVPRAFAGPNSDGNIAFEPTGKLLRFVKASDSAPTQFTEYDLNADQP